MKIPIYSDVHLREDKEHGVPVFSQIIGFCIDNGYSTMACAGDLWHFRRSIPVTPLAHLRRELEQAAGAGIDMYFDPGNHDFVNDTADAEHSMDFMTGYHRVFVASRPFTEYTLSDGTRLVLMPFCPDSKEIKKILKSIPNPEQVVLIGHQNVKGAKDCYHQSESEISPSWYKPFKAVFMGDFHTRQKVGPVQYVGATIQHDFGDVGQERGLCVYDTETGEITWHELEAPKYFQIDSPATVPGFEHTQSLIKDIPDGSYLKLVLRGTDSDIATWDTAAMRKSLVESRKIKMFCEPKPTVTNPVRLSVPVSSPLETILTAFVEQANTTLDTEKLEMVCSKIMELVPDEEKIPEQVAVRIDSLTLRNVSSYEYAKFFFHDGITMFQGVNLDEGGSNASGKSNLLNGMLLCNYWDTEQKLDLDDQIRWGQDSMQIIEELSDSHGNKYEVERTRTRGGGSTSSFKKNGVEEENSVPEVTKKVTELLRMDRVLFCHVVYMTQEGDRSFADATDSVRRVLLSKILSGTDRLDKALKIAKANRDTGNTAVKQYEDALAVSRSKHTEVSSKDYLVLSEQFEASRVRDVEGTSEKIKVAQEGRNNREKILNGLLLPTITPHSELAELNALLIQKPVVQQKKDEWTRFQSSKQAEHRAVISRADEMITQANAVTGTPEGSLCNACGQTITKESAESYKAKLLQQAEQYKALKTPPIVDGLKQAADALAQFKTIEEQFTVAETKLSEIALEESKSMSEYNKVAALRTQVEAEIRNIDYVISTSTTLLESQRVAENPYQKLLTEKEQRLRELEEEQRKITFDLNQAKETTRYFDFWVEAFGPKGVRSFMFDEFINSLTGRINEFIGALFDGVYVTISTTKESSSGDMKEALSINIWKDGRSISINRFSGGEQRLIRLAVNLSMAFAAQERLQVSIGLLILDEVFENLDSFRVQRVTRVLSDLRKIVPCVYIICHAVTLQDQIDNVLVIQKLNGTSTIIKVAA
jgi:DNA repair exonuclease SbcCD nuclease subunit/ABC-type dipeptide/oligopeptide/nickel transport system ATPase subunit